MCRSIGNFVLFNVIINFFTTFFGFIIFSTGDAAHPKRMCKRIEELSSPRQIILHLKSLYFTSFWNWKLLPHHFIVWILSYQPAEKNEYGLAHAQGCGKFKSMYFAEQNVAEKAKIAPFSKVFGTFRYQLCLRSLKKSGIFLYTQEILIVFPLFNQYFSKHGKTKCFFLSK